MVGYLALTEPKRGQKSVQIEERFVLKMRFLQAEIIQSPHGAVLHRRCVAAGKKLRKRGVTQIVLPEEFPFRELLVKCGLRPVATLALRRALAADWVRTGLTEKGCPVAGARVAVSAAALTGEAVRTVTELCLRHRYVLLDLPYGGEELCRQLRREYGVSLLLGPSKDQMEGAEALVLFDPRTDLSLKNPVALRLYDEGQALPPLSLPPEAEEALPHGADRGQLLAVLREAGVLKREQIVLGTGKAAAGGEA